MKTTAKGFSPAFQFLHLMYENQGERMGRSKERFNAGMREAAHVAIQYGLHFDIDDVSALAKQQHPSYGDTSIYTPDERCYSLACGAERGRENPSFCLSYEKWRKRRPFLIADPDAKTPTRVYVGRRFDWYGERVTCTSFADVTDDRDGVSFTACSYKPNDYRDEIEVGGVVYVCRECRRIEEVLDDGRVLLGAENVKANHENKIDRRFTIDHLGIKEANAARKLFADVKRSIAKLPGDAMRELQAWYVEQFGKVREHTLRIEQLKVIEAKVGEALASAQSAAA